MVDSQESDGLLWSTHIQEIAELQLSLTMAMGLPKGNKDSTCHAISKDSLECGYFMLLFLFDYTEFIVIEQLFYYGISLW